MQQELSQAVMQASRRDEVIGAVESVYADLQAEIDQRRPTCQLSGRCCRFEEFGHRLYVTTMELATFVRRLHELPTANRQPPTSPCPFQRPRLCTVHAIRPFGCRLFFCDASLTAWQQEQYAAFHKQLRDLHDELAVRYFYLEWRKSLEMLSIAL